MSDLFNQPSPKMARFVRASDAQIPENIKEMVASAFEAGGEAYPRSKAIIAAIMEAKAITRKEAEAQLNSMIANASGQSALAGYHEAAALGIPIKKAWLADPESCDLCKANEAAGPIEIDRPFPSGHQTTLAHEGCSCTTIQ